MSGNSSWLFLLCSVKIKEPKKWTHLITAAGAESFESAQGLWRRLSGSPGHPAHAERDINYRSAIEQARNFSPFLCVQLDESSRCEKSCDKLSISRREASLIRDEHGNFLLILGYALAFEAQSDHSVIAGLFKNRSVIENIGEAAYFQGLQDRAQGAVSAYADSVLGQGHLSPDDIQLDADAVFPLLLPQFPAPSGLDSLFQKEENRLQREEKSLLADDYPGSFFHVGWNYALAQNFPREVNEQIFVLMAKMQLSYYAFRYYKEYFEEATRDVARSTAVIDYEVVEFFDQLRIGYQGFLSQYTKYKLGLYPKYYAELEAVEKLWHMDKDIQWISDLFMAHAEFVNKKHEDLNQRINLRQQKTLGFIAIMQVLAFMSVFFDSYQFLNSDITWFSIAGFVVVSGLLILTIVYSHKTAAMRATVAGSGKSAKTGGRRP